MRVLLKEVFLALVFPLFFMACGGPDSPAPWPTTAAGLAELADCGNGNTVCLGDQMCTDGNDCIPTCDGATPIGVCNEDGSCPPGGYACVRQWCVAGGGSSVCNPPPPVGNPLSKKSDKK